MKVNKAEFMLSAYSYQDYPRHSLPEIAFSGKSNVGKSSLINTLVNRKNLAIISSRPGRTQSINFYNIDDRFSFVDLPGYGFARVPDEVQEEWRELVNDYLYERSNLKAIIQIVDARHKPSSDDQMMVDWLKSVGLPFIVVATKVDKISKNKRNKQREIITEALNVDEITFFSAKNGEGNKKVSAFIYQIAS